MRMVRSRTTATPALFAAALLLAACGDDDLDGGSTAEIDPAVEKALLAPLLTDPDLAALNEANAALTGSRDQSLPLVIATPEAIRQAQDRAVDILGGHSRVVELPGPAAMRADAGESPLVLLEDVVAEVVPAKICLAEAHYAFVWAARLPDRLPVFPRGAVIEALGQDHPQCALRAVRFASPVPAEDILRFYATLAAREQIGVTYGKADGLWRIEGSRPGAVLRVEVRPSLLSGQEVDLVYASGNEISPR